MLHAFSRTELLLGKKALDKLQNSKVAVFGIGGVGTFAVEGLVRSGVGKFVLIDDDCICLTNLNRQLHATRKTVGKPKVEVMRDRILEINPKAEVEIHQEFYLPPDSGPKLIRQDYDYIVDAVDTVSAKIDIIVNAKKLGIPIISAMGAGNKLDPTKLEVADIYETSVCPLAKVMRKELRNRGIQSLKVVYSKESPLTPIETADNSCSTGCICPKGTTRKCTVRNQIPGSVSFVPSVAGLIMAGEVVKDLIKDIPREGVNVAWSERYSRQIAFKGVGEEGQKKLSQAKVLIVGMGALGSVIANNLCRAGVGHLRLVDRDYVELSNLQRQVIYNEQDARDSLPKAVAAVKHLQQVNSEVELEPVVSDVNSGNIEKLLEGIDMVLDGTDNMETRVLVNEACLKHGVPWIYGAALMSYGMTMNIIPGETACFRCFNPNLPPPGSLPTCSSAGVLSMITGIIGCIEATEAIKILVGSQEVRKNLFVFDVWHNSAEYVEVAPNADCPTCGHKHYEYLESVKGSYTSRLCGRDSVQVNPSRAGEVDLNSMAEKLNKLGTVKVNPFLLKFATQNIEITLFKDGRAIIKNAKDENMAKSIYAEYIGL